MVKDAEAHADEDRKARELVDARNQADGMIHTVKKTLAEQGDKIDADEKAKIEEALKAAEESLKSGSKEEIEAKTQALAEASHKLAEKMYAQQPQGGPGEGPQGEPSDSNAKGGDEGNVVDAEFEEVKDKKKSA
jgi:molecular chaperone DnaK